MKKRLVIKVGSLGVTQTKGGTDPHKIETLVRDLAALKALNHEIFLVSSGAINTGKIHLHSPPEKPLTYQQAASAIGQPKLMKEYQYFASKHQLELAQILVTHEDFKNRERFLNIRNTLLFLNEQNILPVINENDTVSTKEITVGDNDQLAVMIAEAVSADALIILSETDGLYDRDPKDPKAQKLTVVEYNQDLSKISFGSKTTAGRGGMSTKIQAIQKLTPLGLDVYLATFLHEAPLSNALFHQGGTWFRAHPKEKVRSRKAWIASVVKAHAAVVVDEGAMKALLKNSSLLPIGVKKIIGTFKRGDVVMIKCQSKSIGMGIVEFDHKDVEKIKGQKSSELSKLIKVVHHDVVIHRDNLYLTKESI
jgi:glutamate 5-kinase